SATGKDVTTIAVEWMDRGGSPRYVLDRTDPDGVTTPIELSGSPFEDTGLQPGTTYSYEVRGLDSSGDTKTTSNSVSGMTLPMVTAYAKTLTGDTGPGWEGNTLVQRIETGFLNASGQHVRITLQAPPGGDAFINRIYISQADSTGKPYDSAGDLTAVY